MEADKVGPRVAERAHIAVRAVDHQVYVKEHVRFRAQAFDDGDADGDVGHKKPVHHVYVYIIGAGGLCLFDLGGEPAKISGKYGRGDLYHHAPPALRPDAAGL